MKRQDLRASIVIAAVWLLGITMYSILKPPAFSGHDSGIYNAIGALPASAETFQDERAPKHNKQPIRWAHQRWGAV
ncbi:MAG TPA: hypothetical protein VI113_11910 [Alphaproteobacteria bacterium]